MSRVVCFWLATFWRPAKPMIEEHPQWKIFDGLGFFQEAGEGRADPLLQRQRPPQLRRRDRG